MKKIILLIIVISLLMSCSITGKTAKEKRIDAEEKKELMEEKRIIRKFQELSFEQKEEILIDMEAEYLHTDEKIALQLITIGLENKMPISIDALARYLIWEKAKPFLIKTQLDLSWAKNIENFNFGPRFKNKENHTIPWSIVLEEILKLE